VLLKILSRIPMLNGGATYLIRKDHIEITTSTFLTAEIGPVVAPRDEGDPGASTPIRTKPPIVCQEFDNEPLPAALRAMARSTEVNIVLDPKAPDVEKVRVTASLRNVHINNAVRILAAMADLEAVRLNNVLYLTTPQKAARLRKEWKPTEGDTPMSVPSNKVG
jgi:hypothetical protein